MISDIVMALRNVTLDHNTALLPGEAIVLSGLIRELDVLEPNKMAARLSAIRHGLRIVMIGRYASDYDAVWDALNCVDALLKAEIADWTVPPTVTIVMTVTVPASEAVDTDLGKFIGLLCRIAQDDLEAKFDISYGEG